MVSCRGMETTVPSCTSDAKESSQPGESLALDALSFPVASMVMYRTSRLTRLDSWREATAFPFAHGGFAEHAVSQT